MTSQVFMDTNSFLTFKGVDERTKSTYVISCLDTYVQYEENLAITSDSCFTQKLPNFGRKIN
jgi:hypothetical protein